MPRLPVSESSLVALAVLGLLVATGVPFVLPLVATDVPTPGPAESGSATAPGAATGEAPSASPDESSVDRGTPVDARRPGALTPPPDARRVGDGGAERAYCTVGPAGTASAGLDSLARLDAGDPTGADVTIAVLDPTGFDVDDPRIRDSVGATASFAARGESSVGNDGFDRHGTASAILVNRVAPDADLLLANFRTAYDFTRAIEWALDRGADVVVAPTVFYAKPDDGSAPVSRAVADAAEAGVPVVVPTGNAAQRHWAGTHDGGEWVEFSDGRTRLSLRGSSDQVRLWLWWNESDAGDHNVTVHLYEEADNGSRRVARSRAYPRGPVGTNQVLVESVETNDLLSQSVPNGSYHVRVSAPANATHRLELVSTTHRFADPEPRWSIAAPATARAPGVVAVGAAPPGERRPMARSGRGPTSDGRPGIDLLAPGATPDGSGLSFRGTSAAAAYTGGVAALLQAVDPGITPGETERALEASATPAAGNGTVAAGHGLLDADDAVACARNATGP
ncbi:MAG: S8 family serine peptidase [Haloarculaceae archaeon]